MLKLKNHVAFSVLSMLQFWLLFPPFKLAFYSQLQVFWDHIRNKSAVEPTFTSLSAQPYAACLPVNGTRQRGRNAGGLIDVEGDVVAGATIVRLCKKGDGGRHSLFESGGGGQGEAGN